MWANPTLPDPQQDHRATFEPVNGFDLYTRHPRIGTISDHVFKSQYFLISVDIP